MENLNTTVSVNSTIYLLFRDVNTTALNIERRHIRDTPVYVSKVANGRFQGDFIDLLNEHILSLNIPLKYACRCNNDLKVTHYYDEDLQLLNPNCFYNEIPVSI